jgi:hypothetical protein
MADKEFETPQTVDVNKLAEAVAKKTAEEIAKKMTPAAQPTALTEKVEEKKEDPLAYRKAIVEHLRKEGRAQKQLDFTETIGGASGGGMQAWATDVFRCCPYPASAFWDAPYISCKSRGGSFIKWHEDVHGRSLKILQRAQTWGHSNCDHSGTCYMRNRWMRRTIKHRAYDRHYKHYDGRISMQRLHLPRRP